MSGIVVRHGLIALALVVLSHRMSGQTKSAVDNDHAVRFKQYKDLRNLRDADLSGLSLPGQPVQIVVGQGQGDVDPSAVGRTWADYLESYACAADVVVVAAPRAARSAFTTEGTFIFTDYDLEVEAVLKGERALMTVPVQLSWPGGSLVHRGRTINAVDDSFRPLKINGRYLLFLRQIAPGEFGAIRETAGYDLSTKSPRGLGAGHPGEVQDSYGLEALAQAVSSRCGR